MYIVSITLNYLPAAMAHPGMFLSQAGMEMFPS